MSSSNESKLWPQILVLSIGCLHSFSMGIILAFPSNLNAAILSPNSTDIQATSDEASWIASAHGITGLLSFLIFSPLLQIVGRKPVSMVLEVIITLGWILLYFSRSVNGLIFAKSIQGLSMAGIFVAGLTITEFTNRKQRGLFLSFMKIALACGSLWCHSFALIWDWRQISSVAYVPNLLALLLLILRLESPAYYAVKGRFRECEESFLWYHGDTPESRLELKKLTSAQSERIQRVQESKKKNPLVRGLKELAERDFLIPFLSVALVTIATDSCGRYYMLGYITQIMVELISDKYVAIYCSMAVDFLLIIALFLSSVVIKTFNRRTIIFSFGGVSITLMFAVALSVILNSVLSARIKWIPPAIILIHSFVYHVGLVPTAFIISTEMFPINHRGIGALTAGVNFTLFYAFTMKITPLLIKETGIGGTYFIFGLFVAFCLAILYFILPETKDKTLQEIADEINCVERNDLVTEVKPLNDSHHTLKS